MGARLGGIKLITAVDTFCQVEETLLGSCRLKPLMFYNNCGLWSVETVGWLKCCPAEFSWCSVSFIDTVLSPWNPVKYASLKIQDLQNRTYRILMVLYVRAYDFRTLRVWLGSWESIPMMLGKGWYGFHTAAKWYLLYEVSLTNACICALYMFLSQACCSNIWH